LGGLTFLTLRLARAARRRRAARAGFFDLVAAQMTDLRRAVMPTGFARISGRIGGMEIDLQAVPDTLTYRKLPALWLLVTLPERLPVSQRIDLMVRPRGVEPFSFFDRLPCQTLLPAGFPGDMTLRSEHPLSADEAELLRRHRAVFDDPRVKELVLSPQGIRITWLADEADRGRYLIFREAEMGSEPLNPAHLAPILDALSVLRADIFAGETREAEEKRYA
jgi:hypothetical protein